MEMGTTRIRLAERATSAVRRRTVALPHGRGRGRCAARSRTRRPGVTAIGPLRRRCFPTLAGLGTAGHVALTFDDGPDPRSTPRFLDLLRARRTHATFFLLGSMVARSPGLAAELTAAGHEVGVHGWDHRCVLLRGPDAIYDDIARARDAVAEATGTVPAFYRPPYGVLSTAALSAARRLGLTPLLWTCWGREWARGRDHASRCSPRSAGISPGAARCCCMTRTAPRRRDPACPRSAPFPRCWTSARKLAGRPRCRPSLP